jgi:polyphosphate kinase
MAGEPLPGSETGVEESAKKKDEGLAEVTPLRPAEEVDLDDPELFINRELSLLEFQRRVLDEAWDPQNPLLERVKFLAIVSSNLDEFFMVRMAGLKQQHEAGVVKLPPDGMTPAEQLAAARKTAAGLMADCRACWNEELLPALENEHIQILEYDALNDKQSKNVEQYFDERVFPVLTPLAFDPGRPFPHVSNLSLNLAVLIRDREGEERFARIKVPSSLPRLVPVKKSSGGVRKDGTLPRRHIFVWLEQVIAVNLKKLFPGMEVLEAHPFRIVRDADPAIQELEASDLLETIEEYVRKRRFGHVIMLSLPHGMPDKMQRILVRNLSVDTKDAFRLKGPLGLSGLMTLSRIDRHDLKDKSFLPATPTRLETSEEERLDLFGAIRKQDILLHHPYDSFTPVLDFLKAAARDPNVLAIKQTLYRVGRDSPVVDTLLKARENGKEVAVLVELKARFDEESNIEWARALEREGVHVIYGLLGLKTHSKVALVVREERGGIRRYVHLATGNYNPITAHLYTDIGMFTCDPDIGADASDLFNYLTGYSSMTEYRKLLVAPFQLRERMCELIQREIEHCKAGRGGHLIFKMNSLADKRMVKLLYEASQAGVRVDLLVRGICCLRPGIPGVSETINVTSIVGRFLEHSRIYWFHNGGVAEVYLGSADVMPRNLDHRVEVVFPVQDPRLVEYLRDGVLEVQLTDNIKARRMGADGSYERVKRGNDDPAVSCQEVLLSSRSANSS